MLGEDDHVKIHAHFQTSPDTTIAGLKQVLATDASEVTVWRAARGLGYRFKKSRSTLPSVNGRTLLHGVKRGQATPRAWTLPG